MESERSQAAAEEPPLVSEWEVCVEQIGPCLLGENTRNDQMLIP
jgi:hypothetical protein